MKNKIIENLKKDVVKIEWKNKNVWIAVEIAEALDYERPSRLVNYFIYASELVEGNDYELLAKDTLKEFKDDLADIGVEKYKRSPKLILFYESGLVEFLKYRNKLTNSEIEEVLNYYQENRYIKEQSNSIVKRFNGKEIYTLSYNGKPCWIGVEIAEVLGYKEKSRAIRQCIEREEFESGYDYDILHSDEIKEFAKGMCDTHIPSIKYNSQMTILYKEGLLGFINYAHMPIGKEFRKWLRTEVFSELIEMEVGETTSENKFRINKDKLSENKMDNLDKMNNLSEILDFVKIVDRIIDEDNMLKVDCVNRVLKLL